MDEHERGGYVDRMSAAEVIAKKAAELSEGQAEEVLAHLARLTGPRRWTAQELMLLPLAERNRILEAQMTRAVELYKSDPELMMEVVDAPLDDE